MSITIQSNHENKSNLAGNPYVIYLSSLSQGSYNTVVNSLNVVCNFLAPQETPLSFPWHQLRYVHIMAVRNQLNNKYTYSTVNKIMFFVKGVLRECMRLNLINPEDYRRAIDFKPLKGTVEQSGRLIEKWEIEKLFNVCKLPHDKALLGVLRLGLRRNEVSLLDWNNINLIEQKILVRGKGNKERIVFIPNKINQLLEDWNDKATADCVFVGSTNKRIQNKRIADIISTYAEAAGLSPITPHDFRRTFVSELLESGVDLVTVQQMVGHLSPTTTAGYDRRTDNAKRSAVEKLV